jgi:hypothetical protein
MISVCSRGVGSDDLGDDVHSFVETSSSRPTKGNEGRARLGGEGPWEAEDERDVRVDSLGREDLRRLEPLASSI